MVYGMGLFLYSMRKFLDFPLRYLMFREAELASRPSFPNTTRLNVM
jgi:hypothetical protein